jgi:hypothetical protein
VWHSLRAKPSASPSWPKPFCSGALRRILAERVFGGHVLGGRAIGSGAFATRQASAGRVTAWYAGARRRATSGLTAVRRTAPLRIAGLGCLGLAHGTPHQAARHATVSFSGDRGREKSAFRLRASATCSGAAARDEINCLSPLAGARGPSRVVLVEMERGLSAAPRSPAATSLSPPVSLPANASGQRLKSVLPVSVSGSAAHISLQDQSRGRFRNGNSQAAPRALSPRKSRRKR